ncbi:hypothetical protein VIBNISFn27_30001 [Vibrio nigripulchritudo SFn27]|uniref:Uncharacterized protein n=1 Tax=Vibrio nigripulchritudo TaxID=28173 RepID=U4K8P1_9VIBR|nr:hypothetical protein VIBNIBLFn1_640001 [Vibrio nigripulchritudo BLFn1]CCN88270.1 hypothetical protein VIBNISFn27_30001 [Vibrio nigripulchritudo SFn27]CCN93306.1 hypothetical protein VIBNIENn2_120001 [Vibrio nigripulchritudo ENn2]CCO40243.1 hypothetical protein VIBNISFn135_300001 [Vibrio nigripulchritudo SFn135]CCO55874.1 hypothetical protein VIBNIWn13_920003 [Vibrio nigripulchritudo Wn13]CCO61722.1 hypothetical protein VIBNI_B2011 [Vibrio nigripulchritudo]
MKHPQDSNSKPTYKGEIVKTEKVIKIRTIDIRPGVDPNKIPVNLMDTIKYRDDIYELPY